MVESETGGVAGLRAKREARVRRQPPPPRHPRTAALSAVDETPQQEPPAAPEQVTEIPAMESRPDETHAEGERSDGAVADGSRKAELSTSGPQKNTRKSGNIPAPKTQGTPENMIVSPSVLTIENSIMRRFERARKTAPSHTAIVLDALRSCAQELPSLVRNARPQQSTNDLFPWRAAPGEKRAGRAEQLRIRPTVGELGVIDGLVEWVNGELGAPEQGPRRVTRSKLVATALDRYLP